MTENATDVAYETLKRQAIDFTIRPGERIDEAEVAARLGIGRAPVREAMNRLIADGLVTFLPKRGFFCRRLSAREAAHLYEVRADLEIAAVRAIAAEADRSGVEAVREDWRRAIAHTGADDVAALARLDERFHLDLAALAGNPVRTEMLTRINDRIAFVRRINLSDPARRRASFADHDAILDALCAGDAQAAADAVRRHLALSDTDARTFVEDGLTRLYAEDAVA